MMTCSNDAVISTGPPPCAILTDGGSYVILIIMYQAYESYSIHNVLKVMNLQLQCSQNQFSDLVIHS